MGNWEEGTLSRSDVARSDLSCELIPVSHKHVVGDTFFRQWTVPRECRDRCQEAHSMPARSSRNRPLIETVSLIIAVVWLLIVIVLCFVEWLSTERSLDYSVLGYLGLSIVASIICFFAYGIDKYRARSHQWRIPEKTLHTLAMIGGWPGALFGQQFFRHKTQKLGFRLVLWLIVIVHLAAVGYAVYTVAAARLTT